MKKPAFKINIWWSWYNNGTKHEKLWTSTIQRGRKILWSSTAQRYSRLIDAKREAQRFIRACKAGLVSIEVEK